MHIEIHKARKGYTWQLVARNKKVIANNEVFVTKANAERAAKNVVRSIFRTGVLATLAENGQLYGKAVNAKFKKEDRVAADYGRSYLVITWV